MNALKEIEVIQKLWGGYGHIKRMQQLNPPFQTFIVKEIEFPSKSEHPRGWNTDRSHQRKVKSYLIEMEWYNKWASLCKEECYVPKCYSTSVCESKKELILEDLNAIGYSLRKSSLSIVEAKLCLDWLASFHANFMNEKPNNLWRIGTYWHLSTRPDEFDAMEEGPLKRHAIEIDNRLNSSQFQTIVHGDAKVANFCFSRDMKKVAAVDFQYVGGGCGMKDVAYFLGSCLSEKECEKYEEELLNHYFSTLKVALLKKDHAFPYLELEKEWRELYSFAWADFIRFLLGWVPSHQKINAYSEKMVEHSLKAL